MVGDGGETPRGEVFQSIENARVSDDLLRS